jgi:adenosylcobinamide-GDP ribazoletransferase
MSMLKAMGSAFTLMTVLPLERSGRPYLSADVPAFFPWVGWLVGGVAILVAEALRSASSAVGTGGVLSAGGLLVGALIVSLTAVATRMLHWDGLADVADAGWGALDADRRVEILSDSSTGAFGATAISLVAIAQVASYAAIFSAPSILGYVVFASPVLSRLSATLAAWLGAPLRSEGLAAALMGRPSAAAVLIALAGVGAPVAAMWSGHEVLGLIWSGAAIVIAAVTPHLLARRLGGVNGDVMGASILLTETSILVLAGLGSTL